MYSNQIKFISVIGSSTSKVGIIFLVLLLIFLPNMNITLFDVSDFCLQLLHCLLNAWYLLALSRCGILNFCQFFCCFHFVLINLNTNNVECIHYHFKAALAAVARTMTAKIIYQLHFGVFWEELFDLDWERMWKWHFFIHCIKFL